MKNREKGQRYIERDGAEAEMHREGEAKRGRVKGELYKATMDGGFPRDKLGPKKGESASGRQGVYGAHAK